MNSETTLRDNASKLNILNELDKKYGTHLPANYQVQYTYEQPFIKINTEFIRGLIDGDGSFNVAFRTDSRKIGLNFTVVQELSSISVLYELVSFFKCGSVYKLPSEAARYQVQSREELLKNILPVLKDVKLNTRKQNNLDILIQVCDILNTSWYKNEDSLLKIVEIA